MKKEHEIQDILKSNRLQLEAQNRVIEQLRDTQARLIEQLKRTASLLEGWEYVGFDWPFVNETEGKAIADARAEITRATGLRGMIE